MESISVLDIFKIGVGPSSSHTLGPWKAASRFLEQLDNKAKQAKRIKIKLYGSLAKTGKGHGTDIAIMLGLCGEDPVIFDTEKIDTRISMIQKERGLLLGGLVKIEFDPEEDIIFLSDKLLPYHPNALTFICSLENGDRLSETYYSIGGGFVVQEEAEERSDSNSISLPYSVETAADLSAWCNKTGKNISGLVAENEKAWRSEAETRQAVLHIWKVMRGCIYRGCHTKGTLPGGLQVIRRAPMLHDRLLGPKDYIGYKEWTEIIRNQGGNFADTLTWVSCFALAVNEENASFGRVVTAPTNGAAGVIPAVLQYMITFTDQNSEDQILEFLLCASEIGSICKKGATLSAAMGGCQAEIGVSSAMAAAALTECLGGNVEQCLMAAEIAMEHHLGLTCDPIGGLVQIPCIERNTMGAIKAINASQLALNSDPEKARVSLDGVVKTMWDTARDMNTKYKETSEGGLAINIPVCLSEC